jgi:ADP-ribosylglycohydrolase
MLPNENEIRLQRALLSLDGLSVGDAFGECFFGNPRIAEQRIRRREAPPPPWEYTDDTAMALSIVRCLRRRNRIEPDELAKAFAHEYGREPHRGYGGMAHQILQEINRGTPWRVAAGKAFDGQGSCGNGGAMRTAPLGAYFAENAERVIVEARASAEVTHAHPDGQTGAVAVALAAAWMVRERQQSGNATTGLIESVLGHLPKTLTYFQLKKALDVPLDTAPEAAAAKLGNGSRVIASDTVPFCLWCAARHADSYPNAIWTAVSVGGDIDTNCAIIGGIVALGAGREGIPPAWLAAREPLSI